MYKWRKLSRWIFKKIKGNKLLRYLKIFLDEQGLKFLIKIQARFLIKKKKKSRGECQNISHFNVFLLFLYFVSFKKVGREMKGNNRENVKNRNWNTSRTSLPLVFTFVPKQRSFLQNIINSTFSPFWLRSFKQRKLIYLMYLYSW